MSLQKLIVPGNYDNTDHYRSFVGQEETGVVVQVLDTADKVDDLAPQGRLQLHNKIIINAITLHIYSHHSFLFF
jgi:hypothetical protein